MKRKYDEGYALPFALVVLLFLSIVAISIMDLTYRDLKAQQDSIARMEDQYVAQGVLETLRAQIEAATSADDLRAICDQYSDEQVENPVESGTDYTVTVHLEQPGSKYLVTIDCELKAMLDPIRGRYIVEYSSYSINSTEIPLVQAPAPENGGAEG